MVYTTADYLSKLLTQYGRIAQAITGYSFANIYIAGIIMLLIVAFFVYHVFYEIISVSITRDRILKGSAERLTKIFALSITLVSIFSIGISAYLLVIIMLAAIGGLVYISYKLLYLVIGYPVIESIKRKYPQIAKWIPYILATIVAIGFYTLFIESRMNAPGGGTISGLSSFVEKNIYSVAILIIVGVVFAEAFRDSSKISSLISSVKDKVRSRVGVRERETNKKIKYMEQKMDEESKYLDKKMKEMINCLNQHANLIKDLYLKLKSAEEERNEEEIKKLIRENSNEIKEILDKLVIVEKAGEEETYILGKLIKELYDNYEEELSKNKGEILEKELKKDFLTLSESGTVEKNLIRDLRENISKLIELINNKVDTKEKEEEEKKIINDILKDLKVIMETLYIVNQVYAKLHNIEEGIEKEI